MANTSDYNFGLPEEGDRVSPIVIDGEQPTFVAYPKDVRVDYEGDAVKVYTTGIEDGFGESKFGVDENGDPLPFLQHDGKRNDGAFAFQAGDRIPLFRWLRDDANYGRWASIPTCVIVGTDRVPVWREVAWVTVRQIMFGANTHGNRWVTYTLLMDHDTASRLHYIL